MKPWLKKYSGLVRFVSARSSPGLLHQRERAGRFLEGAVPDGKERMNFKMWAFGLYSLQLMS
jgi:hypothetical protein